LKEEILAEANGGPGKLLFRRFRGSRGFWASAFDLRDLPCYAEEGRALGRAGESPAPTYRRPHISNCYHQPVSRRGKFITFEGLDGCGKSTQLERLASALRVEGLEVVETREPGGTASGERIRQILLDSATTGLSPVTEMALMFASRAQHLREVILPGLHLGKFVLCDRFTDSTEAYQGGGRKLGSQAVLELHRILCENVWPDLTILMDSDVSASVKRARRRNLQKTGEGSGEADENRFEKESSAFFGRVHDTFHAIAQREPGRVVVVNARGTPEETHAHILEIVRSRLKLAKSA
jgi:dTMP kinase